MSDRLPDLRTQGERIQWALRQIELDESSFGKRARERAGLVADRVNWSELARRLKTNRTTLYRWREKAPRKPNQALALTALEQLLGVPEGWLTEEEGSVEGASAPAQATSQTDETLVMALAWNLEKVLALLRDGVTFSGESLRAIQNTVAKVLAEEAHRHDGD